VRHEIRTDAIDSTAPFCARLTKERERERATHFEWKGRDGSERGCGGRFTSARAWVGTWSGGREWRLGTSTTVLGMQADY
jgi:hypothetical protein